MKKIFLYTSILLATAFSLCGCEEKESAGTTRITYYAELILEGDETMVVNKGEAYVEPGYSATMKGTDVTKDVQVTNNVDTSTSGVYSVVYSITNEDGFTASKSRTVLVYNTADPVEGLWSCAPTSYRIRETTTTPYGAAYQVFISQSSNPGEYDVDDLLAGWYAQGANYGSDYAMQAVIAIDASNNISLVNSFVPGWADGASGLENGVFNPADSTIKYDLGYAEMTFYVTLKKD